MSVLDNFSGLLSAMGGGGGGADPGRQRRFPGLGSPRLHEAWQSGPPAYVPAPGGDRQMFAYAADADGGARSQKKQRTPLGSALGLLCLSLGSAVLGVLVYTALSRATKSAAAAALAAAAADEGAPARAVPATPTTEAPLRGAQTRHARPPRLPAVAAVDAAPHVHSYSYAEEDDADTDDGVADMVAANLLSYLDDHHPAPEEQDNEPPQPQPPPQPRKQKAPCDAGRTRCVPDDVVGRGGDGGGGGGRSGDGGGVVGRGGDGGGGGRSGGGGRAPKHATTTAGAAAAAWDGAPTRSATRAGMFDMLDEDDDGGGGGGGATGRLSDESDEVERIAAKRAALFESIAYTDAVDDDDDGGDTTR